MLSSNTILLVCFGMEIDWSLFAPVGVVLCNDLAKIFCDICLCHFFSLLLAEPVSIKYNL